MLAGACATQQPIHDVIDARIVVPESKSLSMGEVRTAIERAGRSLGWQLLAERPGVFSGRLSLRAHVAVIEIEHDDRTYSIRYRDSTHHAYNEWIEKLDRAIQAELKRPGQI